MAGIVMCKWLENGVDMKPATCSYRASQLRRSRLNRPDCNIASHVPGGAQRSAINRYLIQNVTVVHHHLESAEAQFLLLIIQPL